MRLTPSTVGDLLFDEVMWVQRARQEHDAFVPEDAELFPVVADALGLDKLRVLRTPIDLLSAEREQWDGGTTSSPSRPGSYSAIR